MCPMRPTGRNRVSPDPSAWGSEYRMVAFDRILADPPDMPNLEVGYFEPARGIETAFPERMVGAKKHRRLVKHTLGKRYQSYRSDSPGVDQRDKA